MGFKTEKRAVYKGRSGLWPVIPESTVIDALASIVPDAEVPSVGLTARLRRLLSLLMRLPTAV